MAIASGRNACCFRARINNNREWAILPEVFVACFKRCILGVWDPLLRSREDWTEANRSARQLVSRRSKPFFIRRSMGTVDGRRKAGRGNRQRGKKAYRRLTALGQWDEQLGRVQETTWCIWNPKVAREGRWVKGRRGKNDR